MQQINPLYRNIILVTSYLFLSSVFFFGGYIAGTNVYDLKDQEAAALVSVPSVSPSVEPQNYRVILEDGELRLYLDGNGISRLISSESISEESFPARDVATLKEGIIFENTEDALTLMENFLS